MNRSDWHSRSGRSSSFIAKSTRFAIYHRDNFRCVYCGKRDDPPAYDGEGLTLDHLVPRDHGGDHKPENLVTACVTCNSSRQHKKHRKPTLQRLQRLASKPLNREVGKLLAELQKQCSRHRLKNPLTYMSEATYREQERLDDEEAKATSCLSPALKDQLDVHIRREINRAPCK